MRKITALVAAGTLLALLAGSLLNSGYSQPGRPVQVAQAKETPKADDKDHAADREAIRKSAAEFAQAFAKGDAKAVAGFWTENGEYRDDSGVVLRGRAAIEKAYAEQFKAKPKGTLEIDVRSIRFLTRDTAVEDGVLRIKHAGAEHQPSGTNYSALHVRQEGKWMLASVNEFGVAEDKLDDIAWLAGNWTAKVKNRELAMSYAWNSKKTQLRNQFSVKEDGKVTVSGIQIIAADPQSGRIRSWIFDDDGGHGQSIWARDGNRWVLDSLGVLPDGRETSSTNIFTRLGEDELLWRSTHRTIGSQPIADAEPVKLTRVKAGK